MLFWAGIAVAVCIVAVIAALEVVVRRAEPVLRSRVIETLSTRYKSRVELKTFHVSLLRGLQVSGGGLEIYPYSQDGKTPAIALKTFSFRTRWSGLFQSPMQVDHVDLTGLRINLPPKAKRKQMPRLANGQSGGKISIDVEEIRSRDAVLTLGTDKPGKAPMEFDIRNLTLRAVGPGHPMAFTATLVNPKPIGDIASSGSFGPWNTDDPGSTPVSGEYSFRNADLATTKGIAGILSSTGKYGGTLDHIVVDGETDTPDFEVDVSGHKVPLHTTFHAIVDGTNGDTYLDPVEVRVLQSSFTARGYITHVAGEPGHQIVLNVDMDKARIEDMLKMGVETDPPVMTGGLRMHTLLEIPPGPQDVAHKLRLKGSFQITDARFTNPQVQSKVDVLSLRSQGKTEKAKAVSSGDRGNVNVRSQMKGDFSLNNGLLTITKLRYDVPGALIELQGLYSLDGNQFNFFGTADLKASLSQMVGGWKGALLTPVSPFFRKNGAGTELPIQITGTRSEPHFGLRLGHKDLQEEMQKMREQRKPAAGSGR